MTSQLFDLSGKKALVTGASRGLGAKIAQGLAAAGAEIICSSSQSGGCKKTVESIVNAGGTASEYSVDLSSETAINGLTKQVLADHNSIDILVNVGGTIFRKPAIDFPYNEWQKVMKVISMRAFYLHRLSHLE